MIPWLTLDYFTTKSNWASYGIALMGLTIKIKLKAEKNPKVNDLSDKILTSLTPRLYSRT